MDLTNFSPLLTTKQNTNARLIRILIVDDQKVILAKLREVLATKSDFVIVGVYDVC